MGKLIFKYLTRKKKRLNLLKQFSGGISQNDLTLLSEDSMSSFGQNIWKILAVSKVNSLTTTQLSGLTSSQITDLINSPNYSSYSSSIRSYAASALDPSRSASSSGSVASSQGSSANMVEFSIVTFVLSFGLAQILSHF